MLNIPAMLVTPYNVEYVPNYAIKGTAVKIQHSSFTSVPAVPYFGC
jgi:hypothetical protein